MRLHLILTAAVLVMPTAAFAQNEALVIQGGWQNYQSTMQHGRDNAATTIQLGARNSANTSQNGKNDTSVIVQAGHDQSVSNTQNGNNMGFGSLQMSAPNASGTWTVTAGKTTINLGLGNPAP